MNQSLSLLHHRFTKAATLERKASNEAYLRDQFQFVGLDMPARRSLFKDWLKEADLPDYNELGEWVKQMWQMEREFQYCAIEPAALYKKEWDESFLTIMEFCITHKSWWDTVDAIASEWTGPFFKRFPLLIKKYTGQWNRSKNHWLQRSSVMFQKQYRKDTDTVLLSKFILHCSGSDEFFIQKAIGWSLREYGKTNPQWVKDFVAVNELKPLSRREALKNL